MEKIELYDLEAVTNYLKGTKFIKNSNNIRLVALWPVGDGNVRILREGFITQKIDFNGGFNKSREFIKILMPGCDIYYEIIVKPETADMRKDLVRSRTIVETNEVGIGKIIDKKYFVIYDISSLDKEELKALRNVKFEDVWIMENNQDYSISYESPKDELEARKGYSLQANDIVKICELDLDEKLLSSDNFDLFVQNGTTIKKSMGENELDDTVSYYPKDDIKVSESRLNAEKTLTFYEYDPLVETPSFGVVYELDNVGSDSNGAPIWRKMPKILQNEYDSEYATRALENGVRTVVLISDEDNAKVMADLEKEGKLDQVKEFNVVEEMGEDFLIERTLLNKDLNNNFSL